MQILKKSTRALPSSMRIKKRYLLFGIISEKSHEQKDVFFSIKNHLLSLFGSLYFAESSFALISYERDTGLCIVKCSRKALPKVKAALVLLNNIVGNKASVRLLRASGTIKALKEAK